MTENAFELIIDKLHNCKESYLLELNMIVFF